MNRTFWFIVICLMVTIGAAMAKGVIPDKIDATGDTVISREDFENSICFKKCHQPDQFSPGDKTQVQWEILIEKDGHAIFAEIPWQDDVQKQQISDYLRENAKGFMTEGIGVWR